MARKILVLTPMLRGQRVVVVKQLDRGLHLVEFLPLDLTQRCLPDSAIPQRAGAIRLEKHCRSMAMNPKPVTCTAKTKSLLMVLGHPLAPWRQTTMLPFDLYHQVHLRPHHPPAPLPHIYQILTHLEA